MAAILEQPAIRRRAHPLSVEAYHALGQMGWLTEQVELLNGVIVDKMPKSPLHTLIVRRLIEMLRRLLSGTYDIRQEQPLTFANSEPEPDVAVVAGSFEDFGLSHPRTAELIIEVAVTSVETDRAKAEIYASAGVKEYWIVDAERRTFDVYRCPEAGRYLHHTQLDASAEITCDVFPTFRVNPVMLFSAPTV